MVITVTGAPIRRYGQKPTVTRAARARSTTIRLAIEPRMVKLPARVDAIASTSQALCGSGRSPTNGFNTRTAGTLLTRFDNTAAIVARIAGWPNATSLAVRRMSGVNIAFSAPATTMNRPAKSSSSGQSIPRITRSGRTRRVTNSNAPATIAALAGATPRKNAATAPTIAASDFASKGPFQWTRSSATSLRAVADRNSPRYVTTIATTTTITPIAATGASAALNAP